MKFLKRTLFAFLLIAVCLCVIPQQAEAASIVLTGSCGDNLNFSLNSDGLLNIGGTGAMDDFVSSSTVPWSSKRTTIKTVVINEGVTSVGDYAFAYCSKLQSITLPESVSTLGFYAFAECENLKSLTFNGDMEEIDSFAFGYCENIETITFNGYVENISKYTFEKSKTIKSIAFNGNVGTIGSNAFADNSVLESVTFGGNVGTIADNAFLNCVKIESLTFEGSLGYVGQYAFRNCKALKSVTFCDVVEYLGNAAFYQCYALESAEFKSDVLCIDNSFSNCEDLRDVVFRGNVGELGGYTFNNCRWLENITFYGSVDYISDNAFNGCEYLENIYIKEYDVFWGEDIYGDPRTCPYASVYFIDDSGNEVTEITVSSDYSEIPDNAFYRCRNLVSVTLPEGIVSIGNKAFYECNALSEITVPKSVKTIGEYVFYYCDSLKSIVVKGDIETIGNYAFYDNNAESIVFEGNVDTIGAYAFKSCSEVETLSFGGTVGTIGEYAFQYCYCIEEMTFNGYVSYVGEYAFYNTRVITVAFNDGVGNIGDSAFRACYSLETVYIDKTLGKIERYAFCDCRSLSRVTVPGDLEVLGPYAFEYCAELDYAIFNGTKSQWNRVGLNSGNTYFTKRLVTLEDAGKITVQPESVTVEDGETARVEFSASGKGLTYKWYYKSASAKKFTYTSTFKSNYYSTTMSSSKSGRQIYCVVTDLFGNEIKTDTVTLSIKKPLKITTQPKSVTVAEGETAKVTVKATGDGLTYKWYYKNSGASKFSYTSSFKGNSYSLKMSEARSGRQVYCVISDKYGNEVKTNTVTLKMEKPVKITTQPKSVTVAEGETAKVTVKASGDGLTYKWYYKSASATKFSYTSTFTGNSYSITMNSSRSGRQVYCVISDKYGNEVKTNTVTLKMEKPLKITTQPKSVTVAEGETAKVTVKASGDGLTYKWYFKNPGSSKFSYTSSFTGNSYSVTMSEARSGRQVYCVITDKYGNSVTTNTVTLKMK